MEDVPDAASEERVVNVRHKDLSGDNELPALLDERDSLLAVRDDADRRIEEINDVVKSRLGSSLTASLAGWWISFRPYYRREHVLQAKNIRALKILRAPIAGKDAVTRKFQ